MRVLCRGERERVVWSISFSKPFLPKCSKFLYSVYKMYVKYRFSILSGTLTVSVENPRETQVEGVLVLPTHPVCIVACTGEANYACCT